MIDELTKHNKGDVVITSLHIFIRISTKYVTITRRNADPFTQHKTWLQPSNSLIEKVIRYD